MDTTFTERHKLWSDVRNRAADELQRRVREEKFETVRFAFADQHGLVRGKTILAAAVPSALRNGIGLVSTNLLKDTSDRTAWSVFTEGAGFEDAHLARFFQGATDVILVPDPVTFKHLPWVTEGKTGWVQCDAYFPDGTPVPFDSRRVLRRALGTLQELGFDYLAGLEVEFHILKIENPRLSLDDAGWPGTPPDVSLVNTGYRLLTEQRGDGFEPLFAMLRQHLLALGLPLASQEIELGPSQVEFVFGALPGLQAADAMILLRNAIKQICRRAGYHATFMCRPKLPHVMSSGWHLHQSLVDRQTGANAFVNPAPHADPANALHHLSQVGAHFLGGLLEHAAGGSVFATPTVNGYRRFRANSLAPDRATWARDNRGAMLRLVGRAEDGSIHIENRAGEPAANPYLYFAAQLHAGMHGLERRIQPHSSADTPYESDAPRLPHSLEAALAALQVDTELTRRFGADLVDYLVRLKQAELTRFDAEVTEWEQREYFEMF